MRVPFVGRRLIPPTPYLPPIPESDKKSEFFFSRPRGRRFWRGIVRRFSVVGAVSMVCGASASRLHGNEKRVPEIHAHSEGPSTGPCLSHGRTRPVGRGLHDGQTQGHGSTLVSKNDVENVEGFQSGVVWQITLKIGCQDGIPGGGGSPGGWIHCAELRFRLFHLASVPLSPATGKFRVPSQVRNRPGGAEECSRGWSEAEPPEGLS